MIGASSSAALAPGFRFHPTDEELVGYYLRRKICGRPLRVDAIAEVDLYKCESWDLPGRSRIRSRDLEWYFFSALDRKYSNRSRTNRATGHGFWKMTGKDRPVRHRARVVGMKKTLVFHAGRAPHGSRTNWVMHEYRLEDEELAHSGVPQDAYVVCRIFQKSGSGLQNGAQHGAPFVEEECEKEEADGLVVVRDGSDHVREQEHFQFTDILQRTDANIFILIMLLLLSSHCSSVALTGGGGGFSDAADYLYDDARDFSEKVECVNSSILGPSNFAEEEKISLRTSPLHHHRKPAIFTAPCLRGELLLLKVLFS
ncbi:hypothetical protein OPV22_012170 [Ensete ventricosum]|uniref:NAC domain-containing protein n=1 Tax=Ensete ventricosum TaxID=4639 RepID=A0AAV8PGT9_ENSVE|nr:hypothetical protein OPV22_012170 [Ensete ventricosum]